jgi:hypothetical protein
VGQIGERNLVSGGGAGLKAICKIMKTNGKRGSIAPQYSDSDFQDRRGSLAPHAPAIIYSPITAADEKIPLSMVRVNSKPQYLVFCLRFMHPPSKPLHLPVESCKWPSLARLCAVFFALKAGQYRTLAGTLPRFKPSPLRVCPQGAELVQFLVKTVRVVDNEVGTLGSCARSPIKAHITWDAARHNCH